MPAVGRERVPVGGGWIVSKLKFKFNITADKT